MTPPESNAVARSYARAVRGWVSECVSARDVDDVVQSVFEAFARDAHKVDVATVAEWLRAVSVGGGFWVLVDFPSCSEP